MIGDSDGGFFASEFEYAVSQNTFSSGTMPDATSTYDPKAFDSSLEPDLPVKPPSYYTDAYSSWATESGRDPQREELDYDLRGYFRSSDHVPAGEHLPDTFKKPNHPTFSTDSQYNGAPLGNGVAQGGQWEKDDEGKWLFYPGKTNLDFHGTQGLIDYFKTREPDSKLILPESKANDNIKLAQNTNDYYKAYKDLYEGTINDRDFPGFNPTAKQLLGNDPNKNAPFPFGDREKFIQKYGPEKAIDALDAHSRYVKEKGEANEKRGIIDFYENTLKRNEDIKNEILRRQGSEVESPVKYASLETGTMSDASPEKPIRDEGEYSVIEEKYGPEVSDTVKFFDNHVKENPEYAPGWERLRKDFLKSPTTEEDLPTTDVAGDYSPKLNQRRVNQINARPEVAKIIEAAAKKYGLDPDFAKIVTSLESGGNPNAKTGSYKGLFQLSDKEHGPGNPFDPASNADRGVRSLKEDSVAFKKATGRDPTATELYMSHQQGRAGVLQHVKHPDQPAWKSMLATGEGRSKGERWAKTAIWGNIPSDMKKRFGSVENVRSRDLMNIYASKIGEGANTQLASNNIPLPRARPSDQSVHVAEVSERSDDVAKAPDLVKEMLGTGTSRASSVQGVTDYLKQIPTDIEQGFGKSKTKTASNEKPVRSSPDTAASFALKQTKLGPGDVHSVRQYLQKLGIDPDTIPDLKLK
jgi:hypothetical protein